MDNAILKKMNAFPAGQSQSEPDQSAGCASSNVITADLGVFHKTQHRERPSAAAELPEPGYAEGVRDGKAQSDLVYQNTIGVMQNALDELQKNLQNMAHRVEVDHLAAVAACLRAAMPKLAKAGAEAEIQSLIADTAQTALKTDVHFTVHPDGLDDCKRLCDLQGTNFKVSPDTRLTSAQVRVSWENGGAEIDSGRVFEDYLQRFESVLETLKARQAKEMTNG